jgi:DNA processing protein
MTATPETCDRCVARAWLLARLAGHLELARGHIEVTLALCDEDLIAALGGQDRVDIVREREQLDLAAQRRRCEAAGIETICRHDPLYPAQLGELVSPPAVLHVVGGVARLLELVGGRPVAIVGSRRASEYGRDMARSLARGIASTGVCVVSGLAFGVDSAAHTGALEVADGPTVAVLPGAVNRPYPAAKRPLYRQIAARGAAVSELPPGIKVRRWAMTVVVEAAHGSGALITARIAMRLGRALGAVPGQATSSLATGPHALLAGGARLVARPHDVLDELFGADAPAPVCERPALDPPLAGLLAALSDGRDPGDVVAGAGLTVAEGLAALSSLELGGYLRRAPGGRYTVVP